MAEGPNRFERIARYKDERRRQLAAQFGSAEPLPGSSATPTTPRTTRASRLRAASTQQPTKTLSPSAICERDKSNKRKSNLNRCEETTSPNTTSPSSLIATTPDSDEARSRRRRRRVGVTLETPPKTELSIHMENARRGVTPSICEMGRYKPFASTNRSKTSQSDTSNSPRQNNRDIAKRMEELTLKTKETLARIERLANRKTATKPPDKQPAPISILKRKGALDNDSASAPHTATPVTFSPNIIESTPSKKKQGILKKRRSLDESQVMRHRSCSPKTDSRSILKSQRRSSLEELPRLNSPDLPLQSILKRKPLEEDDHSLNSPQSILKRRSGASSASSTTSTPHVSITTAVILAAAGGAEMILEPTSDDPVRPILKKKSSDESTGDPSTTEPTTPKPILKKKSSTDTDDNEDKPKPILKTGMSSRKSGKETTIKTRFSFNGDHQQMAAQHKSSRRSHTICSEFNFKTLNSQSKEEDRTLRKPRPLTVHELVKSFEKGGAIPKRSGALRGDRYKTQPVTSIELEASLNAFPHPEASAPSTSFYLNSLLDDDHASLIITTNPTTKKMTSSDSAFQSLGDGLELDEVPGEEQKRRFATQPITQEEVQEAARLQDPPEPSRLSLHDRIRFFNTSLSLDCDSEERGRKASRRRSILKTPDSLTSANNHDEGISCNEDDVIESSDDDVTMRKSDTTTGTSDGESSGGREVRNFLKNDHKFKQTLEGVLLAKSRSQHGGFSGNDRKPSSPSSGKPLRRSKTHSGSTMPSSIADLRAKLQESGESEWRKRVPSNNATDELKLLKEKNRYNDELSEKSLLAARKDELDASAKQWKNRVEKTDVDNFSVAGRMEKTPQINIPKTPTQRTPQAKRFKQEESSSTPVSPEKIIELTRSKSLCEPSKHDKKTRIVSLNRPDDDTFHKFYEKTSQPEKHDIFDLSLADLDEVSRETSLLVLRRNVPVMKRRGVASRNPIKALAQRSDISNEYTEVIGGGYAEREQKRLMIEKLSAYTDKATSALAGLVSTEDFSQVSLKTPTRLTKMVPYKDLMLIQIKGRRHIQIRLVEPVSSSLNEGDNFLLVGPTFLYNFIGKFSNIIENNKAADVANLIQKSRDLGCNSTAITTITTETPDKIKQKFWNHLNCTTIPEVVQAGDPEEDEVYESEILHTNIIYEVKGKTLLQNERFWGHLPKIEILTDKAVLIFDFGSELYVWSGKNAKKEEKLAGLEFGRKLWDEGYDYSGCAINPITIASSLGERPTLEDKTFKSTQRPQWGLFAKLTQHMETILFKEKFLDWPDLSRLVQSKILQPERQVQIELEPNSGEDLLKVDLNPDLIVEQTHLGRGKTWYDSETNRLFEYKTVKLEGWKVIEADHEPLTSRTLGLFYSGDSYVYHWRYQMTVKGRELTGNPSKHCHVGKEQSVFLYWQGHESSVNEQCTAAFITVQLDKESAPQIRIEQGLEPAAFLQLFNNSMILLQGKPPEQHPNLITSKPKCFVVRGEVPCEGYLLEVPCEMASLRSKTSFLIIVDQALITIWHGSKSPQHKRTITKLVTEQLLARLNEESSKPDLVEVEEGSESEDFFDLMGVDRSTYFSLLNSNLAFNHTIRLFRMSSTNGPFLVEEVLCPHRSELTSPFPFVQSVLYSASQPALFLIDNVHELWLWQGWWPEQDLEDATQPGAVRWQYERRAAMQTAVNYWKRQQRPHDKICAFLVSAGLEPLEFKNLFPTWQNRPEITTMNLKEGKQMNEQKPLEAELQKLLRTTYPLEELLQRPLPEGVDPTQLERYLSAQDFETLLAMTKDDFRKLPMWKQTHLKKEKGLF